MVKRNRDPVVHSIQLKIAGAKASRGCTWQQIALALGECGIRLSPANLMSKQSRCSFKTKELLILLRLLDIEALNLADVQVDGLEKAKALLESN